MDKYIKISDLIELIEEEKRDITNEYEEDKMNLHSKIVSLGTLEVLKEKILESDKANE